MNKFFKFGFIINVLLLLIVYMNCGGFWGCNRIAESFVFLSFLFNFPASLFVGAMAKTLVGKAFLMGLCGTVVNGYILGAIFRTRKKVVQNEE